MKETKAKRAEREEAIGKLRELLPEGSVVYTIVTHVSRSGMSRNIRLYTTDGDGGLRYISGYVARALGWSQTPRGDVRVQGCGMDMCFHTVYSLASVLFSGKERAGYLLRKEDL